MPQTTITEALAEIKTLQKRITQKSDFVNANLYRQDTFKDPFDNQGGSAKVISQEAQAIRDLEARIIVLRLAINEANLTHNVSIEGDTRSVAAWIVWKRDVAPLVRSRLAKWDSTVGTARKQAQAQGLAIRGPGEQAQALKDVLVHIDEKRLAEERERLETVLGTLDGRLSLFNATATIEV
jgi:hypothetical protein